MPDSKSRKRNFEYEHPIASECSTANNEQEGVLSHPPDSAAVDYPPDWMLEREQEEKLCTELMEARNTDQDIARLELMACHGYKREEVEGLETGQISSILARERVKEWLEERLSNFHQMTNMEANEMIRRNMLLPAIFNNGKGHYRRFRPGQRVAQFKTFGPNQEAKGTVTRLILHNDEKDEFSYEIETIDGVYLTVVVDSEEHIQQEVGSKIVAEDIFSDWDLLRKVQMEVKLGYPRCSSLREMYGSEYYFFPRANLHYCHSCGRNPTNAIKNLSVCNACHSVAYCDKKCQLHHWAEHKQVCRVIQEARDNYLKKHPEAGCTKNGRRYIRSQSMMTNRYHALGSFLANKCGLTFGATSILRSIVTRAVEAAIFTTNDDEEEVDDAFRGAALHALAHEIIDDTLKMSAVSSQNMLRLIAGVVHFHDIDRELAAWCAAGVDVFMLISFQQPIVPELPRKYAEPQMFWGAQI